MQETFIIDRCVGNNRGPKIAWVLSGTWGPLFQTFSQIYVDCGLSAEFFSRVAALLGENSNLLPLKATFRRSWLALFPLTASCSTSSWAKDFIPPQDRWLVRGGGHGSYIIIFFCEKCIRYTQDVDKDAYILVLYHIYIYIFIHIHHKYVYDKCMIHNQGILLPRHPESVLWAVCICFFC